MGAIHNLITVSHKDKMRIAFLHPDLGIGGAEQLVVNLAVALQKKGHRVKIYTPFHDPNHAFKETTDGTLDVEVRGNLFPRAILNKMVAFCAFVRMIFAAIYLILYGGHFDVIVVDQVSACIPILRLFGRKVLFYCHFPDKLLCVERRSIFKKIYRLFLDLFEEITTGMAHVILVNSGFTQQIFNRSFKLLNILKKKTQILYPAIDFSKFEGGLEDASVAREINGEFFLSLNRYERKKNIGLAIKAFAEYKKLVKNAQEKLVVAGGYEERIPENREHYLELKQEAERLGVSDSVIFLRSVSDGVRVYLLNHAIGVLYTPENEHFGIVPVEAMYMQLSLIHI
eukprot:TRINITY_DN2053_c0_g1_i1.p1 TRINITY_DN2053_c0_g1~~TRINITY_DN2053_c0_g1_i1.p1  ORF type:complete len:341 (+),score=82.83 TRINITY_DN2053_c0_g1_i1:37-1059(+)